MSKLTKNQKIAQEKVEAGKVYSFAEAVNLVKEITFTKFDASLDVDVRLGVDPRKANQMVRGVVTLPHGTGKQVRVLVLCNSDAEAAAKAAGADYVGLDEYIEKSKAVGLTLTSSSPSPLLWVRSVPSAVFSVPVASCLTPRAVL